MIELSPLKGPAGAPVVVLGHSLGASPIIWERVGPLLEQSYRVSYLTLPGHGSVAAPTEAFSMTDLAGEVARQVQEFGEGQAFFAGVSISGALAVTLAVEHSDAFRGVVPMAAVAQMGDPEAWATRAKFVRENTTAALVEDSGTRWFAPTFANREPDYFARILQVLQETPSEGWARCGEALGTYDARDSAGGIEIPTLLIGGAQDVVIPADGVAALAEQIPGARYSLIEEAGHQLPAEQPEHVFNALDEFFREVGTYSGASGHGS